MQEFVDKAGVKELVPISSATLDRLVKRGLLPRYKVGRKSVYERADILRLIKSARRLP